MAKRRTTHLCGQHSHGFLPAPLPACPGSSLAPPDRFTALPLGAEVHHGGRWVGERDHRALRWVGGSCRVGHVYGTGTPKFWGQCPQLRVLLLAFAPPSPNPTTKFISLDPAPWKFSTRELIKLIHSIASRPPPQEIFAFCQKLSVDSRTAVSRKGGYSWSEMSLLVPQTTQSRFLYQI